MFENLLSFSTAFFMLRFHNGAGITQDSSSESSEGVLQPRIIGADESGINVKQQGGVLIQGRFRCGAAFVASDGWNHFFLTTGTCLYDRQPAHHYPLDYVKVFVGVKNIEKQVATVNQYRANKIVMHPCFNKTSKAHNIAIIFTNQVHDMDGQPAKLPLSPSQGYRRPTSVTLSGYGAKQLGEKPDGWLRRLSLPVVNKRTCKNHFKPEKNQFCVGYLGISGKGICEGDDGGPVVAYNQIGTHTYMAGVISHLPPWTHKCGDSRIAGIVTEVAQYLDWIAEEVKERRNPPVTPPKPCNEN